MSKEALASANYRDYEYQIVDTPRYGVMDETWELVDVWPKPRNHSTIYLMVFRREMKREFGYHGEAYNTAGEALSNNNGSGDTTHPMPNQPKEGL